MKGLNYIASLLIVGFLWSCNKDREVQDLSESYTESSQKMNLLADGKVPANSTRMREKINGISYSIKSLSALEFLRRKGERPSGVDVDQLGKEGVILFEFEINDYQEEIFDFEQIQMTRDDAIQYLMGGIMGDVKLEQNGKEFTPNGVLYEGSVTGANKIRTVFFVSSMNMENEFKFQYYDRLFGAGIIKLINKN